MFVALSVTLQLCSKIFQKFQETGSVKDHARRRRPGHCKVLPTRNLFKMLC